MSNPKVQYPIRPKAFAQDVYENVVYYGTYLETSASANLTTDDGDPIELAEGGLGNTSPVVAIAAADEKPRARLLNG